MMDCKIWIDVADVPPVTWIAIASVALVILWIFLVCVKLWLTWGSRRDPDPDPDEQADLHLVDLTSGEILGRRKRGKD
jgi:hypothetical protein